MSWTAKFYKGRWWTREEWTAPIETANGPNIRPDGMTEIRNPVDGKLYDSKSAYYKSVRRAGCEIMGNEAPTQMSDRSRPAPNLERDIYNAIQQLRG